eukprot:5246375-Pleurochrysis_carterae.AAC.3
MASCVKIRRSEYQRPSHTRPCMHARKADASGGVPENENRQRIFTRDACEEKLALSACESTAQPQKEASSVDERDRAWCACLTPAEKTILPTWPEQPLRSSAPSSGSAFIDVIAS